MFYRRSALLLLILILVFMLISPGVIIAESVTSQYIPSYTLVIKVPEQIEAGQTVTLIAQVTENLYDDIVANARVSFFVESDFFISDLVEIGDALTDDHGQARLDFIPNQPGALRIIARYDAGSNFEPIEAAGTVNITGSGTSNYKTVIGIQYPNSFIIWVISIVAILFAIWSTFLFILYQVRSISFRGTGAKGASIILIVGVAVLFTVVMMVLVTPEAQYNFGYLP
jgi:hypothetical protein